VGAQLRRLHDRIPADGWPPFIQAPSTAGGALPALGGRGERRAVAAADLPGAIANLLHGRMSPPSTVTDPELRVPSSDCAADHWLLDAGSVTAAIDFGDAGLGDPVWIWSYHHWDEHRLPAVLDGYGASRRSARGWPAPTTATGSSGI
jgi:hypothetical protein